MKTLTKSKSKRMVAGVCGGIAEYFEIDPTLVRLGFVAAGLRPLCVPGSARKS